MRKRRLLEAFGRDRAGATAIEYAFVAGLVSVTITAAATTIGRWALGVYGAAAGGLS